MAALVIPNGGFEEGNLNHWTVVNGSDIKVEANKSAFEGTYGLTVRGEGNMDIEHNTMYDVFPGDTVSTSIQLNPTRGSDRGFVRVLWYTAAGSYLGATEGTHVVGTGPYRISTVTNAVPIPNAAKFKLGLFVRKYTRSHFGVDDLKGSRNTNTGIKMVLPEDGAQFAVGDSIKLQAEVNTLGTVDNVAFYVDGIMAGVATSAPYAFNYLNAPEGEYTVFARLTMQGGATLDSAPITFSVEGTPAPKETREYNASNAYTQLVMENIAGIGGQIPSTALVTGVEVLVDYKMSILSRTSDLEGESVTNANDLAPLEIAPSVDIETILLDNDAGFSSKSAPLLINQVIDHTSFTVVETGISEEKKWTVRENENTYSVTIGGEDSLWGNDPVAFPDFVSKAIGLRFVPRVGTKPAYAGAGDAVYRFFIDSVRIRVFFDAGSVEYYFASPDKSQIIKGTLVSFNVHNGLLKLGDADGFLQLAPELEVMDGSQTWIGNDWTIHAAYPPTDRNQIGEVADVAGESILGMSYNGLPTQYQIEEERSRYQIITENFYGDPELNSMYGVHGLPRAFAYNGKHFYKIHTQPDPEKDKPRSIANHHGHLALGFHGGRVDLSVVGEPYNYDGALGASSWAFGDKVVGLLPLSGTILGVFGAKSVWGISGTTVDNFATQVISPNIGAIEYTITDMGFPIYANAYGIYTLSQTQEYGDYLGTPMSKDISPWLRPRLLRKPTSDKEVVCAWPVRSKNQYRLAFSDGYVLTMTMNGNVAPTFSKQKYFLNSENLPVSSLYEQPAMVPAAVSSELDDAGEERIHMAPKIETAPLPPAGCPFWFFSGGGGSNSYISDFDIPYEDMPEWFDSYSQIEIDFYDTGNWSTYSSFDGWGHGLIQGEDIWGPASGRGSLRQSDGTDGGYNITCLEWAINAPS